MKKDLLAAVSTAALLFASSAWADGGPVAEETPPPPPPVEEYTEPAPVYEPEPAPEYNWYTTIFAGAAFGDHDVAATLDFGEGGTETLSAELPMETGYLLGWTLGYDNLFGAGGFSLRPEVELSFRQQDVNLEDAAAELFEAELTDTDPFAASADLLTLMGNLWIDFKLNGITPYIGGGVGIGWADLVIIESEGFAWQAGGGVNFDVNERVFLGVGYRYLAADFEEDFVIFLPTSLEYEYRSHEVLANLGVRF